MQDERGTKSVVANLGDDSDGGTLRPDESRAKFIESSLWCSHAGRTPDDRRVNSPVASLCDDANDALSNLAGRCLPFPLHDR